MKNDVHLVLFNGQDMIETKYDIELNRDMIYTNMIDIDHIMNLMCTG